MSPEISRALNALGLIAICAVLAFAFADQFLNNDLPCPLCLLQRGGFVLAGFGLALNIKFGPRPSHYAMMILASFGGGGVATRQVLLHILPGSGSYGDAFAGLHFYTWADIVFILIGIGGAIMLLFDRQFEERDLPAARTTGLGLVALAFAVLIAFANGVSTVAECGGGLCPDNPTSYQLLTPAPAR